MIGTTELREFLKSPSTDDTVVTGLEASAVEFLQTQTGRYFGDVTETVKYFSGNGKRAVWLDELPVGAVVVEEETEPGTWEVVDAADYSVRNYRLVHNTEWEAGEENYRATYNRGYEAGSEPADIRQAVLDLVALKYRVRGTEGFSSERMGNGEFSYTRFDENDIAHVPGLEETIRAYRWVVV